MLTTKSAFVDAAVVAVCNLQDVIEDFSVKNIGCGQRGKKLVIFSRLVNHDRDLDSIHDP
jgi:hypothetical protein